MRKRSGVLALASHAPGSSCACPHPAADEARVSHKPSASSPPGCSQLGLAAASC